MAGRDFPLSPTPPFKKEDVQNYKGIVSRLGADAKIIKQGKDIADVQQARVNYLKRQDTLRQNPYYAQEIKKKK